MYRQSPWKTYATFGGFIAALGLAMYPIFIHPLMNIDEYKKSQEINRKGIDIECVQPGNMKVWSNPFQK